MLTNEKYATKKDLKEEKLRINLNLIDLKSEISKVSGDVTLIIDCLEKLNIESRFEELQNSLKLTQSKSSAVPVIFSSYKDKFDFKKAEQETYRMFDYKY